jgi:hypothetical protein
MRQIPEHAPTRQQAVKLGDERRQRIIDLVAELLTGPEIETHELHHFSVISHFCGLRKIVQDVAADGADGSGDRGAREYLLALVLAAMQRLIADPEPETPTKTAPVKLAVGRPPGRTQRSWSGEYARRLAKMTPERQQAFKAREAARIRDRRAKARLVPGS